MYPVRRLIYYLRSIFTLLAGVSNWPTIVTLLLRRPTKPLIIHLRSSGLRFKVRGPMDVWIVKETCLDRDYDRAGTRVKDGWNVIDIGAGIGDFTISAARDAARGVVHAYEPFQVSAALLQDNLQLNGIANVVVHMEAVSAAPGTLTLHLVGEAVQHSTIRGGDASQAISVSAIDLRQALSRLDGRRCNFLKIDCEGAEYDLLMKADPSCWEMIDHIVMEYHDGVTPRSHADLVSFFQQLGWYVSLAPSRVQPDLGLMYCRPAR